MAKLTADNSTEIARFVREGPVTNNPVVAYEWSTISLRSTGKILVKRKVQWKGDFVESYDYGWKLVGKTRPDNHENLFATWTKQGYVRQ